ncbi:MAG: SRPBCC domain-containing protein [Sandaracinaceae bacterium]
MELTVERVISATPARLYKAWTQAEQLGQWWGPPGVRCVEATVDAQVGSRYTIVHEMPDGGRLVIGGAFLALEPPHRLTFSWAVGEQGPVERVTVSFIALPVEDGEPAQTRVRVEHSRIAHEATRTSHHAGWEACLTGLAAVLEAR